MKKTIPFLLMIFVITKIFGQDYKINFIGSGASNVVDSVKVENITQCTKLTLSGRDSLNLIDNGGIEERNSTNHPICVYPNPSLSYCIINFEIYKNSTVAIILYDLQGKMLIQQQEQLSAGKHTYKLSVPASGVYLLHIKSKDFHYSEKIIQDNPASNSEVKIEMLGSNTNNGIEVSARKSLKDNQASASLIEMDYTPGDRLKLTGYSGGIYATVVMLVPTQSQMLNFNFVPCEDADGNYYAVVEIGTQMWMAENLKTTKYRNGDSIPNINDTTIWNHLLTGAYCYYDNNPSIAATYGKLYNWYTATDSRSIAPIGWHVPSYNEYETLSNNLGGRNLSGGKLKANCNDLWVSPNVGANNESGFTGLPGGFRDVHGVYMEISNWSAWWYSTSMSPVAAYALILMAGDGIFNQHYGSKVDGFSIRCVKD